MNLIIDVVMKADLFQLVNINVTNSKIIPYCPRGITDMVDQIIATVGNNKITALRIWSHGITHWAGGEDYEKGNISLGINNVDADNVQQYKPELNRLARYFTKPARVELRGCSPAKGTGKDMMFSLAQFWGVEVHGSSKDQTLIFWNKPVYVADNTGVKELQNPVEIYSGK